MPTSVTVYFTNRSAANLVGLLDLNTQSDSASRMAEVAGLLGGDCEILIDEPGYTAYGQAKAADWAPLNPVLTMPDGQAVHGDVLIIDTH